MSFANLARIARAKIDRRRQYARLVAENKDLTPRELTDMGADRRELLRHVYLEFHGR
jgi:hypothetical protein